MLRDPEIEKLIENSTISVTHNTTSEAKTSNEYKLHCSKPDVTFNFVQMDGNCNGLFINYPQGRFDVCNFLIRNTASWLGDNMLMMSGKENSQLPKWLEHGWQLIKIGDSIRGYSEKIGYVYMYLERDEMATYAFGPGNNRKNMKTQPVVEKAEAAA